LTWVPLHFKKTRTYSNNDEERFGKWENTMVLANIVKFLLLHPLSKNRFAVLKKFIAWQISNRLVNEKRLFDWIDDARLLSGKGETGLTGSYYVGLHEYEEMGFLLHYLKPDNVFVDVGANAGVYTVLASKVMGCKSVSFEPIPDTFQRMVDQIHLNQISHEVNAFNKGVGSKTQTLSFTTENDSTNKVSLDIEVESTIEVEVTSLDLVLCDGSSYVLKIDVEGFEMEVLKGAEKLLVSGRVEAIIIELNNSGAMFGYKDEEISDLLMSYGYCPVQYNPENRTLTKLNGKNYNAQNTIYIKDYDQASKRVTSARAHTVHSAFEALV